MCLSQIRARKLFFVLIWFLAPELSRPRIRRAARLFQAPGLFTPEMTSVMAAR